MDLFGQSFVQNRIKTIFSQSISSDRLAHAYIFYGSEGSGKEAFAFELAKALNCSSSEQRPCGLCPSCIKISHLSHPDVKFIFAVSKQISSDEISQFLKIKTANPYSALPITGHKNIPIDTIRELKNEAKYAPYEAGKRFFIISGAEYFSREAANSFLKLLEEPPDDLMIILITDDYHALLDTIRSRCQPVHFPQFNDEEIGQIIQRYSPTEKDIAPLIRIARNNVKKIFELLDSDYDEKRQLIYGFIKSVAADNILPISQTIDQMTQKRDKNYVVELLDLLILWLRDALHYLILKDRQELINLDYAESIEKFSLFFQNSNLEKLIAIVEQAMLDLEGNAHPALTLMNLAIEMKNELKPLAPGKETA